MAKYLFALVTLVAQAFSKQPEALQPITPPSRDLPWGKLNFLQTTDLHGWYAGHFQEPQYSGDLGDYISFVRRLSDLAESRGVDFLTIDTGDRIRGNGLYDASKPKGKYSYDIFKELSVDILTTGNHELYYNYTVESEHSIILPKFRQNYIASNLDYIDSKTGELSPMAPRYRILTTKNQGIRLVAFGFIFDFTKNAKNSVVQRVEDTVKENWFQTAIQEDVDLFLVCGHAPLDSPEYKAIYSAIREQNSEKPIQFFGGHSHVRNFKKYDSKSYGFQAGRYMETVGWMSIDWENDKANPRSLNNITFQRRYIDNNLFGYQYHTRLNATSFPTKHGTNVSSMIYESRKIMDLDHTYGCAPRDLFYNRAPYPSNSSILTWLEKELVPHVAVRQDRASVPRITLVNSPILRFDIFKGAFTRDTMYIISPFVNYFKYIKNVPLKTAVAVVKLLNSDPALEKETLTSRPKKVTHSVSTQNPILLFQEKGNLIPGYVTKDDGGDDGDDTIHTPIPSYSTPKYIHSNVEFPPNGTPETVDFLYIDFEETNVLQAFAQVGQGYNLNDTEVYHPKSFTELIAEWVGKNWPC